MGFHETFKALSDPVRRDILILLKNKKNKPKNQIFGLKFLRKSSLVLV